MDNNRINDELSLDELELITGGTPKTAARTANYQLTRIACPSCGEICMVDLRKDSFVCAACHKTNLISG